MKNGVRIVSGTLENGAVQSFVLTSTDRLSLNDFSKTLNDDQILNLRKASNCLVFDLCRRYYR